VVSHPDAAITSSVSSEFHGSLPLLLCLLYSNLNALTNNVKNIIKPIHIKRDRSALKAVGHCSKMPLTAYHAG
jgi:hypothetical protein